jgi:transcriptional regulator of acetoin/glycerol metabolism
MAEPCQRCRLLLEIFESDQAADLLAAWAGMVREPEEVGPEPIEALVDAVVRDQKGTLFEVMGRVQEALISKAIDKFGGDKEVADALGVSRHTIWRYRTRPVEGTKQFRKVKKQ